VEDELEIADILRRALTDAGFTVDHAKDGEEGVTMALSGKPDFILLDVVMPKMDGVAVLKRLRSDQAGKDIPVVLLSNFGFQEIADRAFGLGAFDYWLKVDLEPKAVVAKIKEYLKIA
jgi:DNA-binding response OmpR family regulator